MDNTRPRCGAGFLTAREILLPLAFQEGRYLKLDSAPGLLVPELELRRLKASPG